MRSEIAETPGVVRMAQLRADDRGAVMLMGICMALFLIGSMWVVAGIGDAIVYRDRLQEVADHVAFSSAAVHARGMNLIAALNLILFAASAMHILMGLVTLLANAISFVPFPPVAVPARAIAQGAFRVWDTYYRFQKPVQRGVGKGSKVAAFVYPYLGAASGLLTGGDYGEVGLALSPSMIPGPAIQGAIEGANSQLARLPASPQNAPPQISPHERLALPVQEDKMGKSCNLVASYTLDWIRSWSIVKAARDFNIFGWHPLKGLIDDYVDPVANVVQNIFCNDGNLDALPGFLERLFGKLKGADRENPDGNGTDAEGNERTTPDGQVLPPGQDPGRPPSTRAGGGNVGLLPPIGIVTLDPFWAEMGPKVMWSGGSNGSDWNQVWSWTLGGQDQDQSVRRIRLAQRDYRGANETVDYPAFTAQAEFYYDCDTTWNAETCNDGGQTRATYNMKWRARLRRVRPFDLEGQLRTFVADSVLNDSLVSYLRVGVGDSAPVRGLQERAGRAGPVVRRGSDTAVGAAVDQAKGLLSGRARPGTDSFH